jgi:hypothetical protein
MKNRLILITFFSSQLLSSQIREFTIVDASLKLPVSNVNIFNQKSLQGTISNDDGKFKILNNNDTLTFSHIAFKIKKISINKQYTKDTVFLVPKEIKLDEIIISNIDLKNKLQFILNNFNKLYDTEKKILECTYKEKLKVNNNLVRLSQVQLEWWNRNYNYDFKEKLKTQNQIKIVNIDYSKKLEFQNILSNGGFIENKYLFEYLHLNYYPNYIISYAKNIVIKLVKKGDTNTKIIFNANIVVGNKIIAKLVNSSIYFNNETNAIEKLNLQINYLNQTKKGLSRIDKIPYKSKVQTHFLDINFNYDYKNKLILSSFFSKIIGAVEYNQTQDKLLIEQYFIITGIKKGKKIKRKYRVNLSQPLYDSFPISKNGSEKILLSKEEMSFIIN